VWELRFPDGPPDPHPRCRCWIDHARELEAVTKSWVTLKPHGSENAAYVHVFVDGEGNITRGPHTMVGKKPSQLSTHENANASDFPDKPTDVHAAAEDWKKNGIRSKAFRQWFGDSKIVNDDGTPRVVYHGTSDSVHEFDLDHSGRKDTGWLGTGVYLTTDSQLASSYASMKPGRAGPNIMPVYVRMENPYHATLQDKLRIKDIEEQDGKQAGRQAADEWTRELKRQGYDGVILKFKAGKFSPASEEIVIFDPSGVKSASGNRGTFDSDSADITKSRRY
jgi:hypothetical protein